MKHRILITVTDTRRFRQYTLSQIVKWLVAAMAVTALAALAGGWYYIHTLEKMNRDARQKQARLQKRIGVLSHTVSELEVQVGKKESQLEQLGDRLAGIEAVVGTLPEAGEDINRRLENVTLGAAQLALLFSIVPNGAPLPMEGVTSAYGRREHPLLKKREFHPGIDLRAKRGKPVWTTADGVVEFAGYHKRSGYGNLVIIDHGFGFKTYYGHLKKVTVKRGDTVVKGDIIAISGNTGLSTAPHLHYEIRFLTRTVNPYWFIKWQKSDYRSIFKKIKGVPWESFIALLNHMASQAIPASSLPARK
ncbi:MAG: peptidoglycan DD-metalloendopeptidase family protein [Epsilonproteobacteria bacterium]|nr:peptidoglycan DD-metalloendopeptidase family protein [Campylobacterota bacterium]